MVALAASLTPDAVWIQWESMNQETTQAVKKSKAFQHKELLD